MSSYSQKITKDNAWSVDIIDSFAKMIAKHHEYLSNFQVAGTTLEASAKVYGLRVDSVHNDVMRMCADLGRQSAKSLQKKNRNEDGNDSDGGDKENMNIDGDNPQAEQKKKAKKKRTKATVTQNVKTINGKLETNVLMDPFYAKLNSVVGDTNSSKRLMQNIIPTIDSKLKRLQDMPFWKKEEEEITETTEDRKKFYEVPTIFNENEIDKFVFRHGLSKYVLSSNYLEDDDKDTSMKFDDDGLNNTVINNSVHVDLQFDINAEVEPVAAESQMIMDFGDMQNEDFEDLNEFDEIAMQRCKGLRRQAIVIENMQPVVASNLEYSYRPMDNIDRFWAGPSHWKFRQSRRTAMSIGLRNSMHPNAIEGSGMQQQQRGIKKRKMIGVCHIMLEDTLKVEEEKVGIIIDIAAKKKTQLSNQTIARKWDPKKLKLPIDYQTSPHLFEKFLSLCSSTKLTLHNDVPFTDEDDGSHAYNYNNINDRNYCSRLPENSDDETETNTDVAAMDLHQEFDGSNEMLSPSTGIDEIPDTYEGAPEKIEKISIAFARRAKVVDMKQLKTCTWNLLNEYHHEHPEIDPKFSETLQNLPKILNKQMSENMSMPLAFYAMLHLCNDKGLHLENNEDLSDFKITNVPI
jgi:condensin complex subunit 2